MGAAPQREEASVALESAEGPAHDHAHGAGSHAAAVLRVREARARGASVCVRTTVTRSNLHGLAALGAMLAAEQVQAWAVALADEPDPESARRILPALGLAAPRALHALAQARARGVEPFVIGFPLCVLGPYAGWSAPSGVGPGAHDPPCDGCAARSGCPGLSRVHRERFGIAELRPMSAAVGPERSPDRDALTAVVAAPKTSVD